MCLTSKSKKAILKRKLNCQNSLKTIIGQTLVNLLRTNLGTSICIIYSKGEKYFCSSHKLSCNQENGCLLDCENIEHKGEGSQGVFKVSKGFTEIVENLKWVV